MSHDYVKIMADAPEKTKKLAQRRQEKVKTGESKLKLQALNLHVLLTLLYHPLRLGGLA